MSSGLAKCFALILKESLQKSFDITFKKVLQPVLRRNGYYQRKDFTNDDLHTPKRDHRIPLLSPSKSNVFRYKTHDKRSSMYC